MLPQIPQCLRTGRTTRQVNQNKRRRGEYRKQMAELCSETGIHHEETAPYTPEQNGVAERANRTICDRIRAILAETKLPKELWAEIACAVAHIKNRSPTSALGNKRTPYEALYGKKPNVSHLVAIGTKAYVHTPKKKTKKLDPRGLEGLMVGYRGTNQYRIWILNSNKVKIRVSRDVCFLEQSTRTVGAHSNAAPLANAAPSANVAPHANTTLHGNANENGNAIIYNTIEVLLQPTAEPESETDPDDSESEDESGSGSDKENGKNDDDIYGDDETTPRDATVEPETPATMQSEPDIRARAQRTRKALVRLDPGTYVSA
jgi:hypothetical protein